MGLDYLVHQANKETQVFLDNLDQLVFLVLMVFKDLWDLLVHLVHVVHLVLMVLRVHLVHQDLQDLLVHPLTILTSNLQDTRDHKMMRLPLMMKDGHAKYGDHAYNEEYPNDYWTNAVTTRT